VAEWDVPGYAGLPSGCLSRRTAIRDRLAVIPDQQGEIPSPIAEILCSLAVGCEDDIAGIKFDDLLAAYPGQAETFEDAQGLSAVMGWECQTLRALGVKRTAAAFS